MTARERLHFLADTLPALEAGAMLVDLEFALDPPPPLTPEEIESIRAAMNSDGPRYTTDEVRAHLGLPPAVPQTAEEIEAEFRRDLRELIESIDEDQAATLLATVPIPRLEFVDRDVIR